MRRWLLLFPAVLLLTSCRREEAPTVDPSSIRGGRSATSVSVLVAEAKVAGGPGQPAALRGVIASALASESRRGTETDSRRGAFDRFNTTDDAALLQRLVTLLTVNVAEMLNRAQDREETLEVYITDATELATFAEERLRVLKDERERLGQERSRQEAATRELQRDIKESLKKGDSLRVGAHTRELIDRQNVAAQAGAQYSIAKELVEAYEDHVVTLTNRLRAVIANREVLVSGVRVVEIPGVEDLGILEKGERRRGGGARFGGPL